MPKSVDVLLIALSSPIKIGIYEDDKLIETVESSEKSSEVLPQIYSSIFARYDVKKLLYTNGPGSFMAIKVAFIFLKSISILKKIPLYATDAFDFNKNAPIKAIGKLCFVKVDSDIQTKMFEKVPEANFTLPEVLEHQKFTTTVSPKYIIGAVG